MSIDKYLNYIQEVFDYIKKHGHKKCKVNTICWHFHNYEHGYNHCKGSKKNPYKIEHHGKSNHIINKQYAEGHGLKRKPVWFKFNKKVKPDWWELESGVKVSLKQVPSKFK